MEKWPGHSTILWGIFGEFLRDFWGDFWVIFGGVLGVDGILVRKIQGPMGNRGLKIPGDLSWQAHNPHRAANDQFGSDQKRIKSVKTIRIKRMCTPHDPNLQVGQSQAT